MQSYFEGGNPELDALLERILSQAKPGDKKGGRLSGKRDQLQKLPNGKMQGHGGEYVVNAEATDAFGPLLEQLNRAVPAKAKGKKPEKPRKGKSYWGGGDSGAGQGETGPGPGESGPGASTGGIGVGDGPAGAGTSVDTGAPPAGPGASTAGAVTAGTSGSGGVADPTALGPPGPGMAPTIGAPPGSIGMTPAMAAAVAAGTVSDPSATAAEDDIGSTAFGLANSVPSITPAPQWGGQPVSDAIKGFLAAITPFGLFGPSPNTRGQNAVATVLGMATGMPGVSTGLKGAIGAANNANLSHATSMFGGSQKAGAVTPALSLADMTSMAGADIGSTPGVTSSDTGPSTGPGMGAGDALPAELQALDVLQQQENKRGRASGRSPIEEGLYDLAGRGMQGQNPWALAEAARPFAGNQSIDSLLAAAKKFFAA